MNLKLGQDVKINDSGKICEIKTIFENGVAIKEYIIISDIDNERICIKENKIKVKNNIFKNIINFFNNKI